MLHKVAFTMYAFALLGGIGGKMLWEARGSKHGPVQSAQPLFGTRVRLVQAVATSIDALAVGVTLPMLHAPLALSAITIGVITAALSALAPSRAAGSRWRWASTSMP